MCFSGECSCDASLKTLFTLQIMPLNGEGQWKEDTMKSSCLVGFSIEVGSVLSPPPHTHTHTHTLSHTPPQQNTHGNNTKQPYWLADHALLANSSRRGHDTVWAPESHYPFRGCFIWTPGKPQPFREQLKMCTRRAAAQFRWFQIKTLRDFILFSPVCDEIQLKMCKNRSAFHENWPPERWNPQRLSVFLSRTNAQCI